MARTELKNKLALAVRDINGFFADLEKGNIHMPGTVGQYRELLTGAYMKINSIKELNAFIRKMGLRKKDCGLYWEGLILDGYTLMAVKYNKGDVAELCDGKNLRFLTNAYR